MIALVDLEPSYSYRHAAVVLDAVPAAGEYDALGVRCRGPETIRDAFRWREPVAGWLPPRPILVVLPRAWDPVGLVSDFPTPFTRFLYAEQIKGSELPASAMEFLLGGSVAAGIHSALARVIGKPLSARDEGVLYRIVVHGAAGELVFPTARAVAMSKSTLERWCAERGLVSPGRLLRDVRLYAAHTLVRRGAELEVAARRGKWSNARALARALRRYEVGDTETLAARCRAPAGGG